MSADLANTKNSPVAETVSFKPQRGMMPRWRRCYIVGFGLLGGVMLYACSMLQKIIIDAPLAPKGFIIPSVFGVFVGILIALKHTQNLQLKRELEAVVGLQAAQLQNLETFAPVGIFQCDPDGSFRSMNERGSAMLGYDKQELLEGQTNITDFYVNLEDYKEFKRLLAEHGEVMDHHTQLRRKDDSLMWVSLSAKARNNAGGAFFDGFILGIDARKQVEVALRASEAELQALFAGMTDVVLVLNREGRCLKIPPTSQHLYYKPPAELLGKTLHEVFCNHPV